ncbi:hypothetical protein GA0070624_4460 [Micromonospora rhizosphaerae]|uniref:DUF1440 domain-containing protein n=1 Tax=Micromonospora rhizosphaerae TaxID=568872 RepID=A0A1C6SRV6_9ACTN|nr:hypothetical protein [Micromonospora rhizosphaerae]SCL32374.1 hypothetical protein GA0070624_4460 [Micromonospora rhizosphaerae]
MRATPLLDGAIAGAVGTAALNMVSYLDIVVRARPASIAPEESARRLAEKAHVDLGPGDKAVNRRSGLGALLGYGTGVAAGAAFGLLAARRRLPLPVAAGVLGGGVMATSDGSLAALGVSDPRTWRLNDWVADIVPHLAYGMAAATTWNRLRPPSRRGG